eukprot:3837-Heterococcus_DN1.PRE.1
MYAYCAVSDVYWDSGSGSESSGIGASLAIHREQQHHDEVTLSAVTLDKLQQQTAAAASVGVNDNSSNNSPQHSGTSSIINHLSTLLKVPPMHAQRCKRSPCLHVTIGCAAMHCTCIAGKEPLRKGVALSVAGELLQDLNLNSLAVSSLTVSPPTSDTATLQQQQQQLSPVSLVRSSQQGQHHDEVKRASTPAPSPSHKQRALQEQHEQLLNAASLSPPQTATVLSPSSAMKLMYGSSSSG